MNHNCLVILRNDVERLLNDMAAESIHAQAQGIATDCIGNGDDLFRCAMLEAALDQEVAESIDHQRIGLSDNSFNNFVFLLYGTNFELLLEEDRGLLVVVTDYLVDNVFPIARNASIK